MREDAVILPVPPGDTRFPIPVPPDGSHLPGASLLLEPRHPDALEMDTSFVDGDGKEITAAEMPVDTAGTEGGARSSRGPSVPACHAVTTGAVLETPVQGCGSGCPSLPGRPRARQRGGERPQQKGCSDPTRCQARGTPSHRLSQRRCDASLGSPEELVSTKPSVGMSPGHSVGRCHHHPIGGSVQGTELVTHATATSSSHPGGKPPGAALPSLLESSSNAGWSGSGVLSSCSHPERSNPAGACHGVCPVATLLLLLLGTSLLNLARPTARAFSRSTGRGWSTLGIPEHSPGSASSKLLPSKLHFSFQMEHIWSHPLISRFPFPMEIAQGD